MTGRLPGEESSNTESSNTKICRLLEKSSLALYELRIKLGESSAGKSLSAKVYHLIGRGLIEVKGTTRKPLLGGYQKTKEVNLYHLTPKGKSFLDRNPKNHSAGMIATGGGSPVVRGNVACGKLG